MPLVPSKHCRLLNLPLALRELCEIQTDHIIPVPWAHRWLPGCRTKPKHCSMLVRTFTDILHLMGCRPSGCCPQHTPCTPHLWLPPLFCWASICLVFKSWLRRHFIRELFPVLPQNLEARETSDYHDLFFCLQVPQEQCPCVTNCSILELGAVPVFQYYIQVIKMLGQLLPPSPPDLSPPRTERH